VVGGGTAGLVSAIILKRKLNIDVSVVYSKTIGIIGVGEGSTEHWKEFMDVTGIDQYTLLKECDATFKSGIMFEGWDEKSYFHNITDPYSKTSGQYHCVYGKQISEGATLTAKSIQMGEINKWFLNRPEEFHAFQFHFNTNKLNDFLLKVARSFDIHLYEDEITDVVLSQDGSIDHLTGNTRQYKYDFYIDSTGFRKILISKLGAKWVSFGKYLKMKSAITFQSGDEDQYNYWTLAKAMDYGWMFKIPVWGRHGNGYIFDSDYITADQAHQELEQLLGRKIDIGKQFNFDPGYLDNVWIKNCCAIGLSGSFVEPLEATSIGTSIQQSFLLVYKLSNYSQDTINSYNKSFKDIMENIRDFIVLHYVTKKTNTNFWKDLQNLELPDSLAENLKTWRYRLPIREDFSSLSNYVLFKSSNFIVVMQGLGLFDKGAIRQEFLGHSDLTQQYAHDAIQEYTDYENSVLTIPHKKFIKIIRDEF
jgi:tryptophan halogenase